MSILDWYHQKAEHCMRLAASVADARQRATLKQEAALWREIGADVLRQEQIARSAYSGDQSMFRSD